MTPSNSKEWNNLSDDNKSLIESHQREFPIKVGAIATSFGIIVKKATLSAGISGEIKEEDGKYIIRVNRHDVKERQRFTIAHEIAHFLLHKDKIGDGIVDDILYRSKLSSELETEANKLAADIVMPWILIEKHLSKYTDLKKNEQKIEKLAEEAEISITALKIRLGKITGGFLMPQEFIRYKYAPILSISPAEMTALEELPEKDKDLILPTMLLKGWVGSHKLEKSIERIKKAIGEERYWIADIDDSFLESKSTEKELTGKYPREVFDEIETLLSPDNGYQNWYEYMKIEKCSKAIPTIQLGDMSNLRVQIKNLGSLKRGIVAKFSIKHIVDQTYKEVLTLIKELSIENAFVIFDYGQVDEEVHSSVNSISSIISQSNSILPTAIFSISCSSFPSNFSGYRKGENSIHERLLFNEVIKLCEGIKLIFSDRGSARAERISGGGGIPSPRIDYPLANDWRFIREEFEDSDSPGDGEKEELYTLIANEIMKENYWNSDLRVWGTQVIELTSKGELLGINSPMRSTAVRINIHMHQQLFYNAPAEEFLDTDEDWED